MPALSWNTRRRRNSALVLIAACVAACAPAKETQRAPETNAATPPPAPPQARNIPGVGPLPFVNERSCEGEDCVAEFAALACYDVRLRRNPSDTSAETIALKKDDTVQVRTDIHVVAPGIVVLKKDYTYDAEKDLELGTAERTPATDTLHFKAGDTLYVLQYGALGTWQVATHGKVLIVQEFWAGGASSRMLTDSSIAVARSSPTHEVWWRSTLRDGRVGWWRYNEPDVALLSLVLKTNAGEVCRPGPPGD